jgi:protein-S-isoprenylcysteine O-methyltransferase Ste14
LAAAAHLEKWKILELFMATHIICGLLLEAFLPLRTISGSLKVPTQTVGVAFLFISILLILRTRRDFHTHSQPTDPGLSTTELIVTGTFSYSRNPLTVESLVLLMGLGLVLSNLWFLLLLPPTAFAMSAILIKPEEEYLLETFGERYQAYCSEVPRWVFF